MKVLAFVDLHSSYKSFKKLKEKIKKEKPDVILCAGDLTIFEEGIKQLMKKFDDFKIPFLIIHGNHETSGKLKKICSKLKNSIFLHKNHFIKGNVLILGFGGGGFSKTDPELKQISKKFKDVIKKNKDKKIILMTHGPPYKTNLDKIDRFYCGSRTIRWFIKRFNVDYAISGHIHENFGKKDKIKKSIVLNSGPEGKIIKI